MENAKGKTKSRDNIIIICILIKKTTTTKHNKQSKLSDSYFDSVVMIAEVEHRLFKNTFVEKHSFSTIFVK